MFTVSHEPRPTLNGASLIDSSLVDLRTFTDIIQCHLYFLLVKLRIWNINAMLLHSNKLRYLLGNNQLSTVAIKFVIYCIGKHLNLIQGILHPHSLNLSAATSKGIDKKCYVNALYQNVINCCYNSVVINWLTLSFSVGIDFTDVSYSNVNWYLWKKHFHACHFDPKMRRTICEIDKM